MASRAPVTPIRPNDRGDVQPSTRGMNFFEADPALEHLLTVFHALRGRKIVSKDGL